MERPVDEAMGNERLEKNIMRGFWVEVIETIADKKLDVPWYLTLSGAQGLDIDAVIEQKIINLTETGAIQENDKTRIVAIERSKRAVLQLQKKFSGLKILEVNFQNLISGEGNFSWPAGDNRNFCKAKVINLDLNEPLKAIKNNNRIEFPVIQWIKKLGIIHTDPSRSDWYLCLTFHGEILWDDEVNQYVSGFLGDNLRRDQEFNDQCRDFIPENLIDQILSNRRVDFTGLDVPIQQRILMVIVPKLIANLVHIDGWDIATIKNLFYGGGENAPMVTWIFKFSEAGDLSSRPNELYRKILNGIFSFTGFIAQDGEVQEI